MRRSAPDLQWRQGWEGSAAEIREKVKPELGAPELLPCLAAHQIVNGADVDRVPRRDDALRDSAHIELQNLPGLMLCQMLPGAVPVGRVMAWDEGKRDRLLHSTYAREGAVKALANNILGYGSHDEDPGTGQPRLPYHSLMKSALALLCRQLVYGAHRIRFPRGLISQHLS